MIATDLNTLKHAAALQAGAEPQDVLYRAGKKAAGRLLDGEQHDGYPDA